MRKNRTLRSMAFVPALFCYGVIFFFSSRSLPIALNAPGADKGLHLAEFVFLGLCLAFGWFRVPKVSYRSKIMGVFSSGVVLGGLDEVHQFFVAGRHSDPLDTLVDALGISFGLLIYVWHSRRQKPDHDMGSNGPA